LLGTCLLAPFSSSGAHVENPALAHYQCRVRKTITGRDYEKGNFLAKWYHHLMTTATAQAHPNIAFIK
jgi:hypothetical protein